jgi:hypothetical protein
VATTLHGFGAPELLLTTLAGQVIVQGGGGAAFETDVIYVALLLSWKSSFVVLETDAVFEIREPACAPALTL